MHFRLGDFEFWHIQTHWFALDGGAMFGVVPKVLWSRKIQADDKNRIPMATNPLLVKTDKDLVLVDTGLGEHWDEKGRQIFAIVPQDPWTDLPYGPEDVTLVVLTHLHFDHAGGNTTLDLRPAFPNARYVVQAGDLEEHQHPNERNRASYRPEDIEPIRDRLVVVDGDHEIAPGVRVIRTRGHTKGHQVVLFETQGRGVLYMGDICPTIHHAPLPWIMAYDLYPLETLEVRKRLYAEILQNRWYLVLEHDRDPQRGYLTLQNGKHQILPQPEP